MKNTSSKTRRNVPRKEYELDRRFGSPSPTVSLQSLKGTTPWFCSLTSSKSFNQRRRSMSSCVPAQPLRWRQIQEAASNYSFKRTAATGRGIAMRYAAAAA